VLARKCEELESFNGSRDELQQTLALIDALKNQARAADAKAERDRRRAEIAARPRRPDAADQAQVILRSRRVRRY
jgi:hypothetical protein